MGMRVSMNLDLVWPPLGDGIDGRVDCYQLILSRYESFLSIASIALVASVSLGTCQIGKEALHGDYI